LPATPFDPKILLVFSAKLIIPEDHGERGMPFFRELKRGLAIVIIKTATRPSAHLIGAKNLSHEFSTQDFRDHAS